MPDQYAAPEQSVLDHAGTGLAVHLGNRRLRDLHVVRRSRKDAGQAGIAVFHVRQPDVHAAIQRTQGLHALVAAAVVDDGHRQPRLQSREQIGQEVGRRHQIDIMMTFRDQFLENLPQAGGIQTEAVLLRGDLIVLAEFTAKGTAGEEDGAGAVFAGDHRLLPIVPGGPRRDRIIRHSAEAPFPGGAVCAAHARTEGAVFIGQRQFSSPCKPEIKSAAIVPHKAQKCNMDFQPHLWYS